MCPPPWDQRGIKIGEILPRGGGATFFFSRQEGEYFREGIKISDISLDYPGGIQIQSQKTIHIHSFIWETELVRISNKISHQKE